MEKYYKQAVQDFAENPTSASKYSRKKGNVKQVPR